MLGLKWLAGANITTFACGEISFASRLAVPMTRGLSRGLPLFEARSPLCHCFGRCVDGDVVATLGVLRGTTLSRHVLPVEINLLSFLAGPDRGCVNTTARLWVGSPRVSLQR